MRPLKICALVLALGASLSFLPSAQALSLTEATPPASFADTPLPGTTVALRPELAGTVIADELTPFSFDGVSGSVQSRVVRETSSGTLDFYWRVIVDPSANQGVSVLRLANLGHANLLDGDWRIDGLGDVAPATARLFSDAGTPHDGALNVLFEGPVEAGQSSNFFFIHTEATAYDRSGAYDLLSASDNVSSVMSTFAPSAVPEPSAWALMLAGGLMLGQLSRRRR